MDANVFHAVFAKPQIVPLNPLKKHVSISALFIPAFGL